MRMSSGVLHEQQAALRGAVAEARARVSELEAEERRARRSLEAARAPVLEYLRACEAEGGEADPLEIARLEAPVREAAARASFEPVYAADPETGIAKFIGQDVFDAQARARLEGARDRLTRAEEDLASFERSEWPGLLEEIAPVASEAAAAWIVAARGLADAGARLAAVSHEVVGLGTRTDAFPLGEVPEAPFEPAVLHRLDELVRRGPVALTPLPLFLLEAAAEPVE